MMQIVVPFFIIKRVFHKEQLYEVCSSNALLDFSKTLQKKTDVIKVKPGRKAARSIVCCIFTVATLFHSSDLL